MSSVSFLILTLNEEANIAACIDSVAFADDIVVVDSFSSDQNCEIAREKGARVYQRKFDNFSSQRNYALDKIEYKHLWVFHLDADERFTPDLYRECQRMVALDEKSAYFVPNRIIFLGKWIKHCTQYAFCQERLLKRGEVRFSEMGHGQKEQAPERGLGYVHIPYDHFNFSKGIEDWIAKYNRYSFLEAHGLSEIKRRPLADCWYSDSAIRKRALKSWFVRMPCRPWLKFFYLFL